MVYSQFLQGDDEEGEDQFWGSPTSDGKAADCAVEAPASRAGPGDDVYGSVADAPRRPTAHRQLTPNVKAEDEPIAEGRAELDASAIVVGAVL